MKRRILVFTLVSLLTTALLVVAQDLTVDTIIQLSEGGAGEGVLVGMIKQSGKKFALTPQEVLKLTQAKVPQGVIQFMLDPGTGPTPPTGDPHNPNDPHPSGIYLYIEKNKKMEMTPLEPTAVNGASNSTLGDDLGKVFFKNTQKGMIQGSKSSIRAADRKPIFYFYFDDVQAGLGRADFFGSKITSPNQFACVRLEEKDNRREIVMGKEGMFSSQTGLDKDAMVEFVTERVRAGVYKVSFGSNIALAQQLFDFGVPKE